MTCMPPAPGRADTLPGWTACASLSCSPDNHHMHTRRGTYTSPRMRVQRVLTPAKESAEKGMFLGETAGGGGRAEGGRQQTRWPAAQTITKMGSEIFQRRSGCTQRGALAWLHLPARARLVPWGTTAIRERLRVLPRAGLGTGAGSQLQAADGCAGEIGSGLMAIKGLAILLGCRSRTLPGDATGQLTSQSLGPREGVGL